MKTITEALGAHDWCEVTNPSMHGKQPCVVYVCGCCDPPKRARAEANWAVYRAVCQVQDLRSACDHYQEKLDRIHAEAAPRKGEADVSSED